MSKNTTHPASPITLPRRAITIAEFLHSYGIGRTKCNELMQSGELTTRYLGRRVLIDVESAERWYASLPSNQLAA